MLDLLLKVDQDAGPPVYRQVAGAFAEAIEAGELTAGEQLPTVRAAAKALGVNFNTIARSYRLLEADGHVSSVQGRGTFVRSSGPVAELELEGLVRRFLERAYRRGHGPQDVRWELAAAIRAWMQDGVPPGLEGG
ncbi:MAG: GntR family transcriptional regulator [Anaerolineales bacterium]